jgi:hypothetical protein
MIRAAFGRRPGGEEHIAEINAQLYRLRKNSEALKLSIEVRPSSRIVSHVMSENTAQRLETSFWGTQNGRNAYALVNSRSLNKYPYPMYSTFEQQFPPNIEYTAVKVRMRRLTTEKNEY